MFLLNQRCMIYLLEFQALDLFKPSIVKIPGGMSHKLYAHVALFMYLFVCLGSLFLLHKKMLTLPVVPNAVIFMKGLILLLA